MALLRFTNSHVVHFKIPYAASDAVCGNVVSLSENKKMSMRFGV